MSKKPILFVLTFFAVLGAFLFSDYFFNNPFPKEICPPEECTIYKLDGSGQPIGAKPLDALEKGRTRETYENQNPDFPAGLPIEQEPLEVLESFKESAPGDESEGELSHDQLTYSYFSSKESEDIISSFKNYLEAEGYKIAEYSADAGKVKSLGGLKEETKVIRLIHLSVNSQYDGKRLVNVS